MNEQISIYDKYGGFDFFHDCIYGLYLNMFMHPEIAYHFIGVNIETLSKHQTQFLIRAIGGPDIYEGRPLKPVHLHKNISAYEFAEIAKAFKEVFLEKGIEPADVKFIMNFVASYEKDIVTVKFSRIDRIMAPIYRFLKKIKKLISISN